MIVPVIVCYKYNRNNNCYDHHDHHDHHHYHHHRRHHHHHHGILQANDNSSLSHDRVSLKMGCIPARRLFEQGI